MMRTCTYYRDDADIVSEKNVYIKTNRYKLNRGLAREVCKILKREYPTSRLGNKKNPLDEYLYITLSLRTHERGLQAAYKGFKKKFPSWNSAYKAPIREIQKAILPGGLASQKAKNIKKTLNHIYSHLNEVSLRKLNVLEQKKVESFLVSLPGVGLKSAKCIMMYALGYDVLPVDVHVERISYRLGLVQKGGPCEPHRYLEEIIPPKLRYSFHVCCVQHGRLICRGQHPKCRNCCLSHLCKKVGLATQN